MEQVHEEVNSTPIAFTSSSTFQQMNGNEETQSNQSLQDGENAYKQLVELKSKLKKVFQVIQNSDLSAAEKVEQLKETIQRMDVLMLYDSQPAQMDYSQLIASITTSLKEESRDPSVQEYLDQIAKVMNQMKQEKEKLQLQIQQLKDIKKERDQYKSQLQRLKDIELERDSYKQQAQNLKNVKMERDIYKSQVQSIKRKINEEESQGLMYDSIEQNLQALTNRMSKQQQGEISQNKQPQAQQQIISIPVLKQDQQRLLLLIQELRQKLAQYETNKVSDQTSLVQELTTKYQRLLEENHNSRKIISEYQQNSSNNAQQVSKIQQKNRALLEMIEQLQQRLSLNEKYQEKLATQNSSLKEQLNSIIQQIGQKGIALYDAKIQLQKKSKKIAHLQADLSKEIEPIQIDNSQQIQSLKNQIDGLAAQSTKMKSHIQSLETKLNDKQTEIAASSAKFLEDISQLRQKLQQQTQQSGKKIQDLKRMNDNLLEQAKKKKEQIVQRNQLPSKAELFAYISAMGKQIKQKQKKTMFRQQLTAMISGIK